MVSSSSVLVDEMGDISLEEKELGGDCMQRLRVMRILQRVFIGDFNDILSHSEKFGRIAHPTWLIEDFHQVIQDYDLYDFGMLYRPKKFRFENKWLIEGDCKEIIALDWHEGKDLSIQSQIHACTLELSAWGEIKANPLRSSCWIVRNLHELCGCRDLVSLSLFDVVNSQYHNLLNA
ncbi:hypothetical protein GH714_029330 [Hevea brasiliensis]|uniref:DUF4283 domain-containing protein n=1 Tax=Hevea brasiliensis TaxID=3981 RepID=A0A6A6M583_HEVBR|nr:hypothetical protein GH714_029330 [Hevea brasiliensis]